MLDKEALAEIIEKFNLTDKNHRASVEALNELLKSELDKLDIPELMELANMLPRSYSGRRRIYERAHALAALMNDDY